MVRRRAAGRVSLVGAGPGDPSLITVRGRNLLRRADVVVCDALAPVELADLARPGAERILLGGSDGRRAASDGRERLQQSSINRLMIDRARRGLRVVRLKGGDPNIFGRVGEEADALVRAGIRFEIVPGVSAALGAAASTGVPLTHRRYASTVAFATGHVESGKSSSAIDWDALARADTLVLYMGVRNLDATLRRLMTAGRSPSTPSVLVRWATRPEQTVIRGPLGSIAASARRSGLVPPAILISGEVVRLGRRLDWFGRRPLSGRTIVVTRPKDQAAALSNPLREQGARVLEAPSIELRPPRTWAPLDRALRRIDSYRTIIFTSVNGVQRFFSRLTERSIDVRALAGINLIAIGPATAAAVAERGLRVAALPEEYRAEGILKLIGTRRLRGMRILIPRAEVARRILPEVLSKRGATVDVVPVYRAAPVRTGWSQVVRALKKREVDLVTFTSSSTVDQFMKKLRGAMRARESRRIKAAVIGPVTAKTARAHGVRVIAMPRLYTVEALVAAIVRKLRNSPSGTPRGS